MVKDIDKQFQENQNQRETCANHNCYAPKYEQLDTEYGLSIAVCAYHYIEHTFKEEDKDRFSNELFNTDFSTLEEKWQHYNKKIKGEKVKTRE